MYNQLLPYAVQLQLYIIISENKAATAPITFDKKKNGYNYINNRALIIEL